MAAKKHAKKKASNKIPLKVLEDRLKSLNGTVDRRGGKAYAGKPQ